MFYNYKVTVTVVVLFWMGLICHSNQLTAQNIPDANFAAAIRSACPTCIDASNNLLPPAANLTFLSIFNKNVSDLTGIHGFSSLKTFSCNYNKLTTLPTLPDSLESFSCSNNQLTSLPTLPNKLKFFRCHGNLIYCLPALPNSLSYLSIDANKIKCLPNTVTGLTVFDESGNTDALTLPICSAACSESSCTPPPTPSLTANPTLIKIGESSTLTATNCAGTVTWSTGQTGNSITVNPTSYVNYQAFCTVDGCSSGYASRSVGIACELPTPSVLATPSTISVGDSSVITATGCTGTLTWFLNSGGSPIATGNSIKVKPTQTTGYNVSCTNGSCSSNMSISVFVACSVASPIISANPSVISAGASSTLTATGCAGTVTWWNNNTGGPSIGSGNTLLVRPTQTTTYNASCTANNCGSSNANVQVIVPCSVPTPSVSASPNIINSGESATLNAVGCTGIVTWYKEGQALSLGTGNSIVVTPAATSEYYALCNVNGCGSNDAHIKVAVLCQVGTPSLIANPSTINSGESTNLQATNCIGTVIWANGQTGNSITISPRQTGSYSAICSLNGCKSEPTIVNINVGELACQPPPSPSVSASKNLINRGETITLSASNCLGTIMWENSTDQISIGTGNSISVTPEKKTYYRAFCRLNDCNSGVALVLIDVICNIATPSIVATINEDKMFVIGYSNCNGIINWFKNGELIDSSSVNLLITTTQLATYAASCRTNECESDRAYIYIANPCTVPPTPSLLATPSIIQPGQSSTLTATGCSGTVTWYSSSSSGNSIGEGNSINVKPTQSTNYSAYCRVNNCSSSNANVYVTIPCTVPPTPSVVARPSVLKEGETTTLTATNCGGTITWYKSGISTSIGTGGSISTTVTQSSYYYAYCTVNNCQSNSSGVNVNISCEGPPSPSVSGSPSRINAGQNVTLNATGCTGTVTWYSYSAGGTPIGTGNSLVVSPASLTTYTAFCNLNNCGSGGANVEVAVVTNPCPPTKILGGIISTSTPITEIAQMSITTSQSIQSSANVTYQSPVVVFNPGTEIQRGAVFKTVQRGCD